MNSNYINKSLLVRALAGIPCSKTLEEFQFRCDIGSTIAATLLLNYLHRREVGTFTGNQLRFTPSDKLKVLLICMEEGCQLSYLSSMLNWKDFELLTSIVLKSQSYNVKTNIQFMNPRIQIDLVAISGRNVLVVDCKHWKKMSTNKMAECAIEHRRRAKIYLDKINSLTSVVTPVIVTLNELSHQIIHQIPFVPISKLHSFIKGFEFHRNLFCNFS